MLTIDLPGYGPHPAQLAGNMQPGDAIVHNPRRSDRALVEHVNDTTPDLVTITTREHNGRTEHTTYRKDELFAWLPAPGSAAATALIADALKADDDAEAAYRAAEASGHGIFAARNAWQTARQELFAIRESLPEAPFATITTDPAGFLTGESTVTVTPYGATVPVPLLAEVGGPQITFRITEALARLGYHRVGHLNLHAPGVLTTEITVTTA